MQDGTLKGLSAAYFDDLLLASDSDFRTITNSTDMRFNICDYFYFPTKFASFCLDQLPDGRFVIEQAQFLQKLQFLSASTKL